MSSHQCDFSFEPIRFNKDVDEWSSDNGWCSDADNITKVEGELVSEVANVMAASTTTELLFEKNKPPRVVRTHNKNLFRKKLLNIRNGKSRVDAVKKLLHEYNKHGKLVPSAHTYLRLTLATKKHILYKYINYNIYGRILRKEVPPNYIRDFLLYVKRYNSSKSGRLQKERREYFINKLKSLENNRFYLLSDIVDEESTPEDSLAEFEATIMLNKVKRISTSNRFFENSGDGVYYPTVETPIRNQSLLSRLRRIIRELENMRRRMIYRWNHVEEGMAEEAIEMDDFPPSIQPEMMEDEQPSQQSSSGPVILNALQGEEVKAAIPISSNQFWMSNSTSDALVDHKHASAMEILIKKFKWKSSSSAGETLFNIDLPSTAIVENLDHPAAMLFCQYAYWNGDMKLRIHINTTPFHIGKLIFSWYYSQKFDSVYNYRDNIASSILLPHVCFNASEGNDVVLSIPFRNYRSMLCTRARLADSLALYLGTLRCHVFNPLTIGSDTVVDGYIHLSFENSNFTGITPRVPINIQPEMFPVRKLVKIAEKQLSIIDEVANMDNPPNPTPPIMYTPQFSDSFATGTGDVQNVHVLRLDPMGQTQHPIGSSTMQQETSVKNIITKWGLLRSLTWKNDKPSGTSLFRIDATPEFDFSEYYNVRIKASNKSTNAVVMPPLSVISMLNAYNRGSIEFKIELINSRYHTGALLMSFVPAMKNINLVQAQQSYNATLDVGNISEYVFKVPYINERPYNPRFNRLDNNDTKLTVAPIGEINLFVLNELRCVTGTSDHIFINIYIRAGDDFEVAVPVNPIYSLGYDAPTDVLQKVLPIATDTKSWGCDNWRYLDAICPKAAICKAGATADNVMQFSNMQPFVVYEATAEAVEGFVSPFVLHTTAGTNINCKWNYIAMAIVNNDGNKYTYAIPFVDAEIAQSYVITHARLRGIGKWYPNSPTVAQWKEVYPKQTQFYYLISAQASYRDWNGNVNQCIFKEFYNANVMPQTGEVMCNPTISSLSSLNNGLRLFGERFIDLKDYCRRYQLYGQATMYRASSTGQGSQRVTLRVPVTPIGLNTQDPLHNGTPLSILGEGLIPMIASGFRFYRGAIRFKIIITNINGRNKEGAGEVFYISHKPDIIHRDRSMSLNIDDKNIDYELQSGYAITALSTTINNSITIEVPCYIPNNLMMLQKPNFNKLSEVINYNLGVIDIINYSLKTELSNYLVTIHYSFADDMDLSVFVGFPPLFKMKGYDVNSNVIQPEAADEEVVPTTSSSSSVPATTVENTVAVAVPNVVQPEVNKTNYFTNIRNKMFGKISAKIEKATLTHTRESLNLAPISDNKPDSIWRIVSDAVKKFGSENKHIIISMLSQILHCVFNPSVSSFVLAFVTFLSHLGVECYGYLEQFGRWFKRLFSGNVQPESADDSKEEKSSIQETKTCIIDTILSVSADSFGKTLNFFKNLSMPDFTKGFFKNIQAGALTINTIILLFSNLIKVMPAVLAWMGRIVNPKAWYRWLFFNESDFIKRWIRDVEWVVDPTHRIQIHSQVRYAYFIELLVIIGRDLNTKASKIVSNATTMRYIIELNKTLNEVYNQIALTNLSFGNIGIEPFCMAIYGESQIGKTHVLKSVAADCLKEIGYKTYDNLFYTRPSHTKHWDGVQNEPVCVFDDFLHIKTEATASEHIGEFLHLKSKTTFAPPRAHLNDKGRKYNPLILALTMNAAYPKFDSICLDHTAWMNRRDLLIHAKFKAPPGEQYAKAQTVHDLNWTIDQLATYTHMTFAINKHRASKDETNAVSDIEEKLSINVPKSINFELQKNPDGSYIMENTEWMDITQLRWYAAQRFAMAYSKIKQEFVRDLKLFEAFRPDADKNFDENLQAYCEFINTYRANISDSEKQTLKKASELAKHLKCSACAVVPCVCATGFYSTDNVGTLNIQPQMETSPTAESVRNLLRQNTTPATSTTVNYDAVVETLIAEKSFIIGNDHIHNIMKQSVKEQLRSKRMLNTSTLLFLDSPCMHTFFYFRRKMNDFVALVEDGKQLLIYRNLEVDLCNTNCTCCAIDGFTEKYRNALRVYQLSDDITEFPFLKIKENKKVETVVNRYTKRLAKLRDEFEVEIDRIICPSTWLGALGHFLSTLIKPITYILGALGFVYLAKAGFNAVSDKYSSMTNKVDSLKSQNKLKAEILKTHIPDSSCVESKCAICTPEMAYNLQAAKSKKPNAVVPKDISAQMATDMKACVKSKLARNYFFIVAVTEYGTEIMSRCLGLRDRYFFALDHYIDKFRSLAATTIYYLRTNTQNIRFNISDVLMTKMQKSSLVICKMPIIVPPFKNIVNLFASSNQFGNLPHLGYVFECNMPSNKELAITGYDISWHKQDLSLHKDVLVVPNIVDFNDASRMTSIDCYWSYSVSGKGMCGSAIITDANTPSPIVGLHVAGQVNGGRGYAEAICRETIEKALPKEFVDIAVEGQMFGGKNIKIDDSFLYNNEDNAPLPKLALTGCVDIIGIVQPKFAYSSSQDSRCENTICYNQITTSTYDKPHLSHMDPRFEGSPMLKGCLHHGMPVIPFKNSDIDEVGREIQELIFAKVKPLRQLIGPLTVEQAVCGIPNIPDYDPMAFDTSEGFPFSSVRPKGACDKRWLFDLSVDENGYQLNDYEQCLKDVMEEKNNQRKQGIVPLTVFIDCLKDMKLPAEKCHKTRIFSVSPVDYTIQFRQYFYDFTIAFQKAMFDVESAVGINVDGYQWNDMIQKLLNTSTNFVCGDYSKFGPRLMSACVAKAFEIIVEWYKFNGDDSVENAQIRKILGIETTFSVHLMYNLVYRCVSGAPSGCPITTILNNMVNMMYIRTAYKYLVRRSNIIEDIYEFLNFQNNVCVIFYGDDLIMTVKDKILNKFNANKISQFFDQYDIKFTDALKTGNMTLCTDLYDKETSFLKRNTKRHEKRPVYCAAMDKRAIEETCNWKFKGHLEPEASIIACESMMLNAHGHGSKYYSELRQKVMQFWLKQGTLPNIPIWEDVDWRIYEGSF